MRPGGFARLRRDALVFAALLAAYLLISTWFGLFGPAGLPAPVAARLAAALREALADPALRERFLAIGAEVRAEGPEALAMMASEERARWVEAIRRHGIRAAE